MDTPEKRVAQSEKDLYTLLGELVTHLGWLATILALAAAHIAWDAWVLIQLWTWHVAPLGVTSLPFASAAGVIVIAVHLTHQAPEDKKRTKSEQLKRFALSAYAGLLLLGFGWLFHVAGW